MRPSSFSSPHRFHLGKPSFPFANGKFIGIDEAGRGCLAGPVVAAAVWLPQRIPAVLDTLDDSKKLKAKHREHLAGLIRQHALCFGVGFAWQQEIDRINILQSTFAAMARAWMALGVRSTKKSWPHNTHPLLLPLAIDGNFPIPQNHLIACLRPLPTTSNAGVAPKQNNLLQPKLPQQLACIAGDAHIPAIAAASIIAKTVRDDLMNTLHQRFPQYGFNKHKGYAVKAHIAALQQHGPCLFHRMTFKKVRPEREHALPLL